MRLSDSTTLTTEEERRESVSRLVSAVFDDNLNPGNDDALRLGAGPVIAFDDEPTDVSLPGTNFRASRTIKPENLSVYDPTLELNEEDERHGDMVRGQYVDSGSHSESGAYERDDFLLEGDSGYDAAAGNDAFLVRLRRSDDASALDNFGGVSSHGPTVSFLFGRGPYGGPDLLDRRERGTIVRATAIARTRPAYVVGVGSDSLNLAGLLNVQMDVDAWMAGTTVPVGSNTETEAQLVDPNDIRLTTTTTVGEVIFSHSTGVSPLSQTGYVVLTDDTIEDSGGTSIRRVVGFGLATDVLLVGSNISFARQLPQPVASQNAGATVRPPSGGDWDDLNLSSLFDRVRELADSGSILLAPALVRSVD